MSRIRSRGNADTELALARLLRAEGISGWRRHLQVRIAERGARNQTSSKPGAQRTARPTFIVRPDFVFKEVRLALFVDGCFWHGCPKHGTKPRNNAAFWRKKLTANVARDRRVNRALRAAGWRVLRIWEHDLKRGVWNAERGTRNAERGIRKAKTSTPHPRRERLKFERRTSSGLRPPSPQSGEGSRPDRSGEGAAACSGQPGNLQPATCNVQPLPAIVRRVQRALIQGGSGSNRGIRGCRNRLIR
jgi:DNA mismatch endonuclease (patch repair protein)